MERISIKSCRICLINKGTFSIFEKREELSAADMLNNFTELKIIPNGEISTVLCLSCLQKVEDAFTLIKKCYESEKILMKLLEDKEKDNKSNHDLIICDSNLSNSKENEIKPIKINGVSPENTRELNKCTPKKRLDKKRNKCDECGKIFKCYSQLIQHSFVHSGIKPFNCVICSKRFNQMGNLITHQKRHENDKKFICEICSKQFISLGNLKQHSVTHLVIRSFKCEECPKTFTCEKSLKSHKGLHTGNKNHVCGKCGKCFYKTNYLTRHTRTVHLNIKDFKCTECNKSFSSNSNLQAHFRIHSGEKPFQCKFCNAKFNQSSPLVRHTQQHLKKDSKLKEVVNRVFVMEKQKI